MRQAQMGTSRRKPSRSLSMPMATDTVPFDGATEGEGAGYGRTAPAEFLNKGDQEDPEGVIDATYHSEHQPGDADDHPAVKESSRLAVSFLHRILCPPWVSAMPQRLVPGRQDHMAWDLGTTELY